MTAPRRLLESSGSDTARALVRAGSEEQPPTAAMQKTLVALGVGTAVATATTGATAGTAAAGAGASATVAKAGMGALGTKIGIALFVGALAVGGTIQWARTRRAADPAPPPSAVTLTTAVTVAPSSMPASTTPPVTATSTSSEPIVEAAPSSSAPTTAPSAPVVKPSASASLASELALMEEAHRALAAGDTTKCLAALDRYDREHPGGAFAQEVVVTRIEALAKRGDRKSAKALADRFLASHPGSPYAARIRSLIKDPSNP